MYTKNLVFKGKRRKIRIDQSAFKVSVGDPFAQYWCIDFGLLWQQHTQTQSLQELITRARVLYALGHFLGASTARAVRGTIAIKGIFEN